MALRLSFVIAAMLLVIPFGVANGGKPIPPVAGMLTNGGKPIPPVALTNGGKPIPPMAVA